VRNTRLRAQTGGLPYNIRPRMRRLALAISILLLAASSVGAAVTKSFRQTTAKDFEEGEATGSMIMPTGDVVPGMKSTAIALDAAFVWCAATSPDGKVSYFGTGDQGRIYAVDAGSGEGRARLIATLEAAWVTALAVRPDGTLIAGTTPGGRVYAFKPGKGDKADQRGSTGKGDKTGKAAADITKPFATLPAEHVWALALDNKTGTVYAATGGPGKVFAIDSAGKSRPVWDSGDRHVVSLIAAGDRHLYAGTSEEAILYKVSLDGRAEALADFDAEEVRAIARHGTSVYAAVNDFERSSPAVGVAAAAPRGTRVTASPSGSPASAGSLPRPGQRKAKAALYRLDADGRMEQMFSIPDGYFTTLAFDADGRAYVGTGSEGRVYRVAADRSAALAIDVPERQALTLLPAGKGFLIGTGDVGGIYRAEPAGPKQASYLSRVLDGEFRARWRLFRWHGSPGLAVESRSGNTAKPDATWSGFTALERPRSTAEGGVGQIASPPARYVQYRVTFDGPESRLGAVTLAYLPQNQRARITELGTSESTVSPPAIGALGALAAGSSPSAAPRAHQTVLKLRWKVENPDGDELAYRLAFREENEAVWRPLGGPDPLTKTELDWNTEGLPDGNYVVRVTASDERSEPRDRALETSFTSSSILVDNRKPEVVGLVAKLPYVSGRARDDQSPLSAMEYAVDGGEWQVLAPNDGIADDVVEAFTIKLPPLPPGPHAITVRVWDSADNVGAAGLTVRSAR
jgi:outer membrane protein assembly factor BamB